MEDSKALSPETKQLFENIELLTEEYKEAFDILDREKRKSENDRRNLQTALFDIRREVKKNIDELNKVVQDNLASLRFEINKTIKVYGTIDSVVQLRKPLTELQTKLEAQSVKLDKESKDFIERAKADLLRLLDEIRDDVKKALDEAGENIENRIIGRQKMIEARMMENDQKVTNMVIQKNQEIATIRKDIDSLLKKHSDMNTIVTEMNKTLYELYDFANQELAERIRKIERNL